MTVLTFNEGEVIAVIRRQSGLGDPVPTHVVRDQVLRTHGIRYDAADRALAGLIRKGVAVKPSRGFYLPAPSPSSDLPKEGDDAR